MSPKDLALIEYIPQLIEAGVDSFKVEGRTKSLYYVSAVAKTYRKAIDAYFDGKNDFSLYKKELLKVGNRGYTTGFYLGKPDSDGYSYDVSKGLAGADFLFEFIEKNGTNFKVKIKNKIRKGDFIEIITPDEMFQAEILKITDDDGFEQEVGNTNDEIYVSLSVLPQNFEYEIARTIGIKNER